MYLCMIDGHGPSYDTTLLIFDFGAVFSTIRVRYSALLYVCSLPSDTLQNPGAEDAGFRVN